MIVEFETSKGKFALVELPYNTFNLDIRSLGMFNIVYFEPSNEETEFTAVSNYKEKVIIIGLVKDLAEEDWEYVVDKTYYRTFLGKIDKSTGKWKNYNGRPDIRFNTATESGKSLIESLNLSLDNLLLIKYKN